MRPYRRINSGAFPSVTLGGPVTELVWDEAHNQLFVGMSAAPWISLVAYPALTWVSLGAGGAIARVVYAATPRYWWGIRTTTFTALFYVPQLAPAYSQGGLGALCYSLEWSGADRRIFVPRSTLSTIARTPDNALVYTNFVGPLGARDTVLDTVGACIWTGSSGARLQRNVLPGLAATTYITACNLYRLAVDRTAGYVFGSDGPAQKINRHVIATGVSTAFNVGRSVGDLVADPGRAALWSSEGASDSVGRYAVATMARAGVAVGGPCLDVAVESATGYAWAGGSGSGFVHRVAPAGGTSTAHAVPGGTTRVAFHNGLGVCAVGTSNGKVYFVTA